MHLFVNNAINSTYCLEYYLKPSRIQDLVHFLCLPKENEPKEKAPVSLGPADCPVLLEAVVILQTRYAQTVQNPLSTTSPVLGKCQWGKERYGVEHAPFEEASSSTAAQ
ncbi:MAG TPA: hypothetical protein ENG79_01000 [Desulfobacteraceae bacterium]|nr:hypothetical protein [Desulfobacteraceae bacterium]